MRTPGRRPWEVKYAIRLGTFISFCMLASSIWFLYGRVEQLESPHNPHYGANHCDDCHQTDGRPDHSAKDTEYCFSCHDRQSRAVLPGAPERLKEVRGSEGCAHAIKNEGMQGFTTNRTVTALCLGCHKKPTGFVAMVDIVSKKYVEIDMKITHPIGLMPTATIYPRTLPLSRETGAINCTTCHDQHATDKRLRMLRYYYPGNGRPADFRPLCLDCHIDGWLPLKLLPEAVVKEGRKHD